MSDSAFATIEPTDLETINGGNWLTSGLSYVGRAAGKLAWPVTAAVAAYDGYQGYSQARARGASVTDALGAGAQNAASGATFGLIPPPR